MRALYTSLHNTCMHLGRCLTPAGGEGGGELPAHKRQSVQYSTLVGPSFLNTSVHAHAHAPIGQTAYLTCIVRNLHNYTVRVNTLDFGNEILLLFRIFRKKKYFLLCRDLMMIELLKTDDSFLWILIEKIQLSSSLTLITLIPVSITILSTFMIAVNNDRLM